MDELVNLVSEKTGIPKDTARQAVDVVLGYLKDRLPPPIAKQLDAVARGEDGGDIAGKVGGLLGKQS